MRYPDTRPPIARRGFAAAFLDKVLGKPAAAPMAASTAVAPLAPVPSRAFAAVAPALAAETNGMLNLGQIAARLGYRVSAEFLRSLGIEPAGREQSAMLYREADFLRLLDALESHHAQIRGAYLQRRVA